MKRALAESETTKRELRDKQMQIHKTFREANFQDLIRRTETNLIQNKLNEIFLSLERTPQETKKEKPIYEVSFPELFFY
jgi:hypothetical protein